MAVYRYRNKWRADLYDDGKRVNSKAGFKTKKDASRWHETAYKRLIDEKESVVINIRFEELIKIFEKRHFVTVRETTARRYRVDLSNHILPFFKYYYVNSIQQPLIDDFKSHLLLSLSDKSVNNCISLLKIIFRKAVEWSICKNDPTSNTALQKIAQSKYSWWSNEEDIKRFLSIAKQDRYYLAYRLAIDLGMRLGEIIGLSKEDINLKECSIHIHRQWLDKENKFGPTKHGKERIVFFVKNSTLHKLLEEKLISIRGGAIFLNSKGNRLGNRKLSGYFFQKLIQKADVPVIRFHDLRHTFASWFMLTHDNIWQLKEILGHQDIQTTQRYAHLSKKNRAVFSSSFE